MDSDMNTFVRKISYQTKIVDLAEVELEGELVMSSDGYSTDWCLTDRKGHSVSIEDYFEKMEGKRVRISLKVLGTGPDDSKLLGGAE